MVKRIVLIEEERDVIYARQVSWAVPARGQVSVVAGVTRTSPMDGCVTRLNVRGAGVHW